MANPKHSSFKVRCSQTEKQQFQRDAMVRHLSLSEYVRRLLRKATGRDEAEQFYQRQRNAASRLLIDLRVVQSLTAESTDPQVKAAITRLLQTATEVGQ